MQISSQRSTCFFSHGVNIPSLFFRSHSPYCCHRCGFSYRTDKRLFNSMLSPFATGVLYSSLTYTHPHPVAGCSSHSGLMPASSLKKQELDATPIHLNSEKRREKVLLRLWRVEGIDWSTPDIRYTICPDCWSFSASFMLAGRLCFF